MSRPSKSNKVLLKLALIILILLMIFFGRFILEGIKYLPVMLQLVTKNSIELKQATNHKVNILILGTGGGKHEGPDLTDTIIFANLDTSSSSAKANLVSIPRDLWVPEIKGKINKAYADGQAKKNGGGLLLAKAVTEKVLGQPIDYGLRVDFAGFVKAVDMVGGIDVKVERTLDDYAYPITGKEDELCGVPIEEVEKISTDSAKTEREKFPCRYEHLHVSSGEQHMDGELALKFVRSRHAEGIEGSDFARSKRQEKVIQAFKEKIFSMQTLLNPIKLSQLYDVFKGSIDTDIAQDEYDDFIRLAEKTRQATINSYILDSGDMEKGRPELLYSPNEKGEDLNSFYGAWVLLPKAGSGNYTQIHEYIKCILASSLSCLPK